MKGNWNEEEAIVLANNSGKLSQGGVDIVDLANRLGIEVISTDECDSFFNASIKYLPEENKFQILVNENHSRNRVRFSIAHEIAHFILHRDTILSEGIMKRSFRDDDLEKQADDLAGRLLIPDEMLEEFIKRNNIEKEKEISKDQLSWMSNFFRVSIIVAAIRLRNYNYKVPYISFSYVA